jgi:acyl-coenzyme A synthetase/AMP-(fatty) acid ligase
MNALNLMLEKELNPRQLAFYPLDGSPIFFGELLSKAVSARAKLRHLGVGPGDSVLLADQISGDFYSTVMAVMSLGATIILVEPFLPLKEIEAIVSGMNPKVMIASWLGRAWGLRIKAIRSIPNWISAAALCGTGKSGRLHVEPVASDFPGIITFTSGTTGRSKGVVRTHAGLTAQNLAIHEAASMDQFKKPDLAIFANLVLANLGMGRGTIFVPPKWKKDHLRKLDSLPFELQPETLSCGPAFLSQFLKLDRLPPLRSIHVGGALTDVSIFQEAFRRFPETTRFMHVYGSSEAEPVAVAEARKAVEYSMERGFIQTLYLGNPIRGISGKVEQNGFWVSGMHVCPRYIGNDLENQFTKRIDEQGILWHLMGDRIESDEQGLWFMGRSFQQKEDFLLEQKIYTFLRSTHSFIHRDSTGQLILWGEGVEKSRELILKNFPEIHQVKDTTIVRDRRHRARIDRKASI